MGQIKISIKSNNKARGAFYPLPKQFKLLDKHSIPLIGILVHCSEDASLFLLPLSCG